MSDVLSDSPDEQKRKRILLEREAYCCYVVAASLALILNKYKPENFRLVAYICCVGIALVLFGAFRWYQICRLIQIWKSANKRVVLFGLAYLILCIELLWDAYCKALAR